MPDETVGDMSSGGQLFVALLRPSKRPGQHRLNTFKRRGYLAANCDSELNQTHDGAAGLSSPWQPLAHIGLIVF